MQEVLEAIERHLGRSLPISQLDYYQVIGLEVYCDDPQQIRKALQDATNRWMQSETGKHPESAQIIAKLLKQAQTILLDEDKRERYNLQLKKLRGSQTDALPLAKDPGPANSVNSDDSDVDSRLFPSGDPMVPFSFETDGVQSASRGAPCVLLERIRDPHVRLAELEQLFPSLAEFEYESQRVENTANAFAVSSPPKRDSVSGGVSLAQQISRKRKRKRILVSLLFFFGAQAILGVAIWAYMREQSRIASKDKGLAKGQFEAGNADAPKLPGIPNGARNENGIFPKEKPTEEGSTGAMPSMPKDKSTNGETKAREPVPKPEAMTQPTTEPVPEPMPMPSANPVPEKPAPMTMEDAAPTAESSEWKKRMAMARESLNRADFATFEKEIAQGVETAQTPMGRDQAARLDQLGQLYKIGTESFEEARKKLKGTSSIRVGTTEFSIVETTAEKLVVRVSGKNQSHPWDKLPFGIAIALLDLTLDPQASTDVAARAVFFSLAPQFREAATKNELLKKRIDAWFEKTVGKDPIRNDLPQALTDSFE